MSDLEITIQNDGKTSVLTLKGTLDENSDFSKINIKGVQEIIIDTQFVTMMNSCGTRNWVLWMHTIPSTMRVRFINCSMAFIDQANLFEGFFPKKTIVDSFYVPYVCESCQESTNLLLRKGKEYDDSQIELSQTTKCNNCGKNADLNVIESVYFKFLESLPNEVL